MTLPMIVKTELDKPMKDLANSCDHKTLAIWAAECAQRTLHYFTDKYDDPRPTQAIAALHTWIKDSIFIMANIRARALGAHAAAREVPNDNPARSAARAAGQAIATAHVPAHAIGPALYGATAVRDATGSFDEALRERRWQYKRLLELKKLAPKYHGIILDAEFNDSSYPLKFKIFAKKKSRSLGWLLYGIAVHEADIKQTIGDIQANMKTDKPYYAHFYGDNEIIVIFKDKVFSMTPDERTWTPAVSYGETLGIIRNQLVFAPTTFENESKYFKRKELI